MRSYILLALAALAAAVPAPAPAAQFVEVAAPEPIIIVEEDFDDDDWYEERGWFGGRRHGSLLGDLAYGVGDVLSNILPVDTTATATPEAPKN